MKQSAGFDTSALPPAVSSLGTPNAVYGLDTTWEYLMWFCVFGLALIALLMGLVAVKPFGVHPPPPAVGAIGFLVCGGAALGFLISLMKIRGHYYLLFPSSLVVMDYEKYVIIPWESITGLHMIGTQSANRYSVQTRDGQKYTLESYVNDVAGLATAIRQSVEHGRGSVAGASTFKANIPASAATSPRANNGFWPNVDTLEGARAAAMQGVGTSIFCCLATVAVVVLNSTSSQHLLNLGPSALIDAVFFAAIGAGIYNMSRAAAIAGLGLYLIERVVQFAAIAHTPGAGSMGGVSVMALFLTMMYVNSIRGTFAYHRLLEAGAGASQAAPVAPIADPILAPSPATYPGSGIPTPVAAQAAPVAPMASDPVRTEPPVQTGLQPRIIDDLAPDREWRPDWSGFTPSASQDIAPPSPEARWADPSFPGVRTGGWSQGAVPSRGPQTPGGPTDHAAYLDETGYTGKRYTAARGGYGGNPQSNPAVTIALIVGGLLLVSVVGSLILRITLGAVLNSRFQQVQQALQHPANGGGIPFAQFTPWPTMQPWPTAQPWPTDSNGNLVTQPTLAPFPDSGTQNPNSNP